MQKEIFSVFFLVLSIKMKKESSWFNKFHQRMSNIVDRSILTGASFYMLVLT